MRVLIAVAALVCCLTAAAQRKKEPVRHKPVYTIDSVLQRRVHKKLPRAGIAERAARSAADCNTPCTPLPVDFLEVEAERKNKTTVWVQWQVANELNVQEYVVERSFGDARHFQQAGIVAGGGENSGVRHYPFTDANNFSGETYYRIRQVDKDGRYMFSKIVKAAGYTEEVFLQAFPNPAVHDAQLHIWSDAAGSAQITVYDAQGRVVCLQACALVAGSNRRRLPVQAFAAGVYRVQLLLPSKKQLSLQLVKQ